MRPESAVLDGSAPRAARASAPAAVLRPAIAALVQQHAEEALHLRHLRSAQVRAPQAGLAQLLRLDERLEAHLDGLAVAGAEGLARAEATLEQPGSAEMFTAFAAALQAGDAATLQRLLALAQATPSAWRGAVSALGWISPGLLREPVRTLLADPLPWRRALGLHACRLHRVQPGAALAEALRHPDPQLREAALHTAGTLGCSTLLPLVLPSLEDPSLAAAAVRAACLLGARGATLGLLEHLAFATPSACDALRPLAVQLLEPARARAQLRALAAQSGAAREAVRAIGWLGDVRLLPWLIERMAEPALARVAGEAFSTITGADLAALELERPPPQDAADTDDDPDMPVAPPDDDAQLPWPDAERVQRWWQARAAGWAQERRCFCGGPAEAAHLQQVLHTGSQRQRALAAQHLVLLQPGSTLFPVAAPAWRQRRLLAAMAVPA